MRSEGVTWEQKKWLCFWEPELAMGQIFRTLFKLDSVGLGATFDTLEMEYNEFSI